MAEHTVAKVSDIGPGTSKAVHIGREDIMVCNVDGTIYAIEDVCTHDGGQLDQGCLEGCVIECPRHGAQFDVTTGAVLKMPAVESVRTYHVRVDGDSILVEV